MLATRGSEGLGGRPSTDTGQIPPPTAMGRKLMYAALETPGSARTRVSTAE
jgi:hypothetical protein